MKAEDIQVRENEAMLMNIFIFMLHFAMSFILGRGEGSGFQFI